MPSSSAVRAGQAYIEVGTDNAKLNSGVTAAGDRLKSLGASVAIIGAKIAAVGGLVTGLFKTASNSAASMGAELISMSERTGFTVETLSELKYATAETGTSMSALESSLGRLGKTMLNAIQGNREARQAFANIGLSVADLQGMHPEQQFESIANRLMMIGDPALRAAAAIEIFGNSGADLLPLLKKGSIGIDELRQKARDLGLTMSGEDAAAAKAYGDGIRSLGNAISMAWAKLGQAAIPIAQTVVPIFVDLTKVLTLVATAVGNFFTANRAFILWIAKVAVAVVAAGTAIVAIGAVLSGVGAVLGVISSGFAALGTVIGVVISLIGAVLSPIGLLLASLAGLVGYLLYSNDALGTLSNGFQILKQDASDAFGGIADALAAGDITLAMKVLWSFLKLEWAKGTDWLSEKWNNFIGVFVDGWQDAVTGIASFFLQAWGGLQMIWVEICNGLLAVWEGFCETAKEAWDFVVGGVTSSIGGGLATAFAEDLARQEAGNPSLNAEKPKLNAMQQKFVDLEKDRRKQIADIRSETEGRLSSLRSNKVAEQEKRNSNRTNDAADASKALEKAQQEFRDSLKEAKEKRTSVEAGRANNKALAGAAAGGALGAQAAAGAQFAGVTAPTVSGVSGTFSAAVAGRLTDSSVPAKQLERLQSIDENIEAIKNKGGVAFAR